MTDNGAAMKAEEFIAGLHALSIVFEPTLPYAPYQNGKQEVFWSSVEGRLMAMLRDVPELTLDRLNEYTSVRVEQDYNRRAHREIGCTPWERYKDEPNVGRVSLRVIG